MSVRYMNWAWDQQIPMASKIVLLALADRAGDDGRCWPGHETLSDKCSMSRSSVIEHTKKLKELGLISWAHRAGEGGHRTSNVYQLNIETKVQNTNVGNPNVGKTNVGFTESKVQITPVQSPESGQDTSEKHKKNHQKDIDGFDPKSALTTLGVPPKLIRDWLSIRKAKRQPLTETGLESTIAEAEKAGMSLHEVIQICCEKSWAGFRASYIPDSEKPFDYNLLKD